MPRMAKLEAQDTALVVEPEAPERVSKGGIHLPDSSQGKATLGRVVSAGPESGYEPGDTVLFSQYAGTSVNFQQREWLVVKGQDVLAKVTDLD